MGSRKRTFAGLVTAAVTLGMCGSAAATSQTRYSFSGTDSGVIDCGGFEDDFTDAFSGHGTVFFDGAGNALKVIEQDVNHSADTNSATGLTLHEHDRFAVTLDLVAQTVKYAGGTLLMNRRGSGLVIHDSGIQIWDFNDNELFEGGLHQAVHEGDAAWCSALE